MSDAPTVAAAVGGEAGPSATLGDTSELARSGAINLAGVAIYGVLSFALVVIITRELGAAGSGEFFIAMALFNVLARSAMLGADIGLTRFIARFRALERTDEIRHVLRIALPPVGVVGTAMGATVFLAAEPLARVLSGSGEAESLVTYLRVMAPFLPLAALYQTLDWGNRGFGTMVPSVVVERIGRAAVTPAVMLTVFALGSGATAIALAWVGPMAVALVPAALWTTVLVRRVETRHRRPPVQDERTGQLRREFWRFALPRLFGGLFQIAILWVDSLLVGALASTTEAGIYAAATRWLIVGNVAGTAITLAFGPQISYLLAQDERERQHRLFETATSWFIIAAWPAYATAMVFAPTLLRAFGEDFGAGSSVIVIIGAAYLFGAATGPVDVLLLMAGRSSLSLFNNGVALAINIGLNVVLIPRMGIKGAAVAWAVTLFVTNGFPLAQTWRYLRLHPFGPRWLLTLFIGSAFVTVEAVVRLAMGPSLAGLAVGMAAGLFLYAVLLHRFRDRLQVHAFIDVLRRRRSPGDDDHHG